MTACDVLRTAGIAAALFAAFGTAEAAEILAPSGLNTAASSGSIGLGYTPNDGPRFGQYNGINEKGAYGLLDFNFVKRDDETGTWLNIFGRNVGLEDRQLRFEHQRQGNWGYFIDYSRIPRFEPWSITTGVTGIGTPNLAIPTPPTAGVPVELKTVRDAVTLGFEKFLFGNWDFQVRFKNEVKEGSRIFARGTTGGGVVGGPVFGNFEFAPEPIDSTTRQLDAKINYTGPQLQLSGGYYGTMYNNEFTGLNITGGAAALNPNPPGPCPNSCSFTPIALPPDNQSHQFYLAGGYGFTPTTRGTFKVAYARATQDDAFVTGVNVPLAPGIGNNLDGRVDTTLAQAGITSRPIPKLTLLADLRYQDRDDKTPVRVYLFPTAVGATTDGTNEPRSISTTTGKAEASYALPNSFRLTGGIGYEEKKRNTSTVRVVSYRETTDELSYRVELRRMMSETVTGALAYVHSDRDGSPFQTTTVNGGGTGSNLIAPIHLADRKRDKVRFTLNWMVTEPLTLNFFVEEARDDYSPRDGSTLGPMEGSARNYSIDAAYVFTERLQATAWYTLYDTKAQQSTCANASGTGVCPAAGANPVWQATLKNLSNNLGLGMRGKPAGRLEVGADLSYSDIKDEYQQEALVGNPIASLPDISTKLTRINLFGKYALQKNSGVRLDYIYDRYKTDDWTWSTWMYADGTRITQDPNQTVNFFGVTYYYRWQ
jgi:MtrB/PioB family decaheme-associated outer membrane protein